MQDPSQGVAQQLQHHVHLISGHRFGLQPRMEIEQAFRYLLDAPTIVKQTAPMYWSYAHTPSDGTIWLEWISPRTSEHRFASDGYVWGDPEQTWRQDYGGYTIEVMSHSVGFRPNFDTLASHARTRYHFVQKNPSVNAATPDPSLWIVHWHQTERGHPLPIGQVPISGQMRQIMGERSWLEKQGRLERKDFMLHDREHWPTITLPGMQQPGMFANPMLQQQQQQQQINRFPSFPQHTGQPPMKRQRVSTANAGSTDGLHDTSVEDEENTSLGDFFDHLSPREISMARYVQHHRWMEEVFSSPYASSQIVPPDLGLGLMGELKGLTEGILSPPSAEAIGKPVERANKAKEAQPFTNLKKEQLEEFNRRVEKHLEEGQAEIERMKKDHAEKMAEWKKTKTLMQAEKRLRYATWEGHESAMPAYRLDMPPTNGHAEEGASTESVESVIKDVENLLGVKIKAHKDATMVEKGGLEKEEEQLNEEAAQRSDMRDKEMSGMHDASTIAAASNSTTQPQSSINQLLHPAPGPKAEALQPNIPASLPQPNYQSDQSTRSQAAPPTETQPRMPPQPGDDLDGMNMGDTSMMDMDVDDTGDIDFVEHDELESEGEGAMPGDSSESVAAAPSQPQAPATAEQALDTTGNIDGGQAAQPITLREAGEQQVYAAQVQPQAAASSTAVTATAGEQTLGTSTMAGNTDASGIEAQNPPGDNDMFNDGTFDDLTNMDDGNNDGGLIDFEGGMDDSAFGEAMHGMETPGAGGQGEGNQDES